jgi:hypothetical protein
MFTPFTPKISFLIKASTIHSVDEFIHMNKEKSFLTSLNISSCSISQVEPVMNALTTIDIPSTSVDFIISNIDWNKHFHIHDEICWVEFMVNHRLKKMNTYMYNYSEPMFICECNGIHVYVISQYESKDKTKTYKCHHYLKNSTNCYSKFKHNIQLLEFVLENTVDDCFNLINFLVKHSNISNDWNTLSKYVRSDDVLVITDENFEFNVKPYISITPNIINVHLPKLIIWSNDVSVIDSDIDRQLGFIPPILYKAIKYDYIIIVFKPFKSNVLDKNTKEMIKAFYKLN